MQRGRVDQAGRGGRRNAIGRVTDGRTWRSRGDGDIKWRIVKPASVTELGVSHKIDHPTGVRRAGSRRSKEDQIVSEIISVGKCVALLRIWIKRVRYRPIRHYEGEIFAGGIQTEIRVQSRRSAIFARSKNEYVPAGRHGSRRKFPEVRLSDVIGQGPFRKIHRVWPGIVNLDPIRGIAIFVEHTGSGHEFIDADGRSGL